MYGIASGCWHCLLWPLGPPRTGLVLRTIPSGGSAPEPYGDTSREVVCGFLVDVRGVVT